MDSSLVSVVIPTYNRADCLAQTLSSVFAQTHREIEILLVDDGSTDGTRALVERCWSGDSRLRYIQQPNGGVSAARNRGMREARGAYIALLDSDDSWMPWKLGHSSPVWRLSPGQEWSGRTWRQWIPRIR